MKRLHAAAAGVVAAAVVATALLTGSVKTPPLVPDPQLTPGATLNVTTSQVCVPGYSRGVRNVPEAEKEAVYSAYGITSRKPGEFEVDHLVSLELGGSNDQANLWPEQMHINVGGLDEGAKTKDAAEDRLHLEVCAGRLTLQQAQDMIRHDWRPAYLRYFGHFPAYNQQGQ